MKIMSSANVYGELWTVWCVIREKSRSILKYKNWTVLTDISIIHVGIM